MTETIFDKLVLHSIWSFTYGKIFNFYQVFWGAVSACLELTFYVNEINILHLLTDVRRKGSTKHKEWRMFRVKQKQKDPTVTLYGKCRRKKGQLAEREESRCSSTLLVFHCVKLTDSFSFIWCYSLYCFPLSYLTLEASYRLWISFIYIQKKMSLWKQTHLHNVLM